MYVFFAWRAFKYVFFWDPQCLWFVTNLNIAQICFMIEILRNDQHWWLVCFPLFCVCFFCLKSIQICFFLGSTIFVICYKSKYSSDMFYDWKFSEMISNDDWYVFLYSVYVVFCLKSIQIYFLLESRMPVICYKSKYSSDMFYDWKFSEMVQSGSAIMTGMFFCILCMFCLSKEHPHMFFLGIHNICDLLQI